MIHRFPEDEVQKARMDCMLKETVLTCGITSLLLAHS